MRRIITILVFAFLSVESFSQRCLLNDVEWELLPIDAAAYTNNVATLTAQIEDGVEYYYQWYKDGLQINEPDLSQLSVLDLNEDTGYHYYHVKGFFGHPDTSTCFTSNVYFSVLFIDPAQIVSFEIDDAVKDGSVQLELIMSTSANFEYTWYHDDLIVQKGFSNTLIIDEVIDNGGEYYVDIRTWCGTITSESKFLDIITGIEDKILYNNKEVQDVYNTMGQEVSLETANQTIIVKYTDGTTERIYNVR